MTYLEAVNIVLREGGIIAGDDDEITSFSETQHENHLNLAKRAIKRELNDLLSDKALPYEEGEAYITLVSNQRLYSVASDFIRFTDPCPFMLEVDAATSTGVSQNRRIFPYKKQAKEEDIRRDLMDYRDTNGEPQFFYVNKGTTHQVGFYPVPDTNQAGDIYRYWYQKNRSVSVETDVIPMINAQAAESFAEGCGIHFNYLRMTPQERQVLYPGGIQFDPDLQQSRSKTIELIKIIPAPRKYGRRYHA